MPQGERFQFDRLSEAALEQHRRQLEIKRGKRRPILLSPVELLALKQGRVEESQTPKSVGQGLMPLSTTRPSQIFSRSQASRRELVVLRLAAKAPNAARFRRLHARALARRGSAHCIPQPGHSKLDSGL